MENATYDIFYGLNAEFQSKNSDKWSGTRKLTNCDSSEVHKRAAVLTGQPSNLCRWCAAGTYLCSPRPLWAWAAPAGGDKEHVRQPGIPLSKQTAHLQRGNHPLVQKRLAAEVRLHFRVPHRQPCCCLMRALLYRFGYRYEGRVMS